MHYCWLFKMAVASLLILSRAGLNVEMLEQRAERPHPSAESRGCERLCCSNSCERDAACKG